MTKNRLRHWPVAVLGIAALGMAASIPVLAEMAQLDSKAVSPQEAKEFIGGDNFVFSISIGSSDEWWLTHADDAEFEEFPMGTPPPENVEMEYVTTITVLKYPENSHCYWITVGGKPVKCCPTH